MIRSTAAKYYFYNHDGTVYFHMFKPSIADSVAPPEIWDQPATSRQITEYATQYAQYLSCELIGAERQE